MSYWEQLLYERCDRHHFQRSDELNPHHHSVADDIRWRLATQRDAAECRYSALTGIINSYYGQGLATLPPTPFPPV
jgi:hypothetical protein